MCMNYNQTKILYKIAMTSSLVDAQSGSTIIILINISHYCSKNYHLLSVISITTLPSRFAADTTNNSTSTTTIINTSNSTNTSTSTASRWSRIYPFGTPLSWAQHTQHTSSAGWLHHSTGHRPWLYLRTPTSTTNAWVQRNQQRTCTTWSGLGEREKPRSCCTKGWIKNHR